MNLAERGVAATKRRLLLPDERSTRAKVTRDVERLPNERQSTIGVSLSRPRVAEPLERERATNALVVAPVDGRCFEVQVSCRTDPLEEVAAPPRVRAQVDAQIIEHKADEVL